MQKSNIIKNAMILCVIALILSTLLGMTNEITKDPITEQNQKKKQDAYAAVFKDAVFEEDADLTGLVEKSQADLAANGFEGITINEVLAAKDTSSEVVGIVMNITTSNGYAGDIVLAIGVTTEGTLTGMEVISHKETPGLGENCTKDKFKEQFANITSDEITYTKSGKTAANEIDAISSATITTKAVTGAVNAGLYFAYDVMGLQ